MKRLFFWGGHQPVGEEEKMENFNVSLKCEDLLIHSKHPQIYRPQANQKN
jgi:hypothetical protein